MAGEPGGSVEGKRGVSAAYAAEVAAYLDYCQDAWRQMRGQLDPQYHPTEDGAVKLIFHRGDKAEAEKIRQAFRDLTQPDRPRAV